MKLSHMRIQLKYIINLIETVRKYNIIFFKKYLFDFIIKKKYYLNQLFENDYKTKDMIME